MGAAGMKLRNGNHRAIQRISAARDNGLQCQNNVAADDDRINRAVRTRGMAAPAGNRDVQPV